MSNTGEPWSLASCTDSEIAAELVKRWPSLIGCLGDTELLTEVRKRAALKEELVKRASDHTLLGEIGRRGYSTGRPPAPQCQARLYGQASGYEIRCSRDEGHPNEHIARPGRPDGTDLVW